MQKSSVMLITSGALIVIGLALVVVGNQMVLEGVEQGSGMIHEGQELAVPVELDAESETGVFAAQIIGFTEHAFSAAVLDPSGIEIATQRMGKDTVESEFGITQSGTYQLIIRSSEGDEYQAFGAIGPVPDAGKKALGHASLYVLILGMAGLVVLGIYGIRKKRVS